MSTKRPLPAGFFGDQISQKPKTQQASEVSAEESVAAVDEEWAKFQAESFYHETTDSDLVTGNVSNAVIEADSKLTSNDFGSVAGADSGAVENAEVESDHDDEDRLLDDLNIQKDFYKKVEKLKQKVQSSGHIQEKTESTGHVSRGLVEDADSESSDSDSEDDLLWKKSIS